MIILTIRIEYESMVKKEFTLWNGPQTFLQLIMLLWKWKTRIYKESFTPVAYFKCLKISSNRVEFQTFDNFTSSKADDILVTLSVMQPAIFFHKMIVCKGVYVIYIYCHYCHLYIVSLLNLINSTLLNFFK